MQGIDQLRPGLGLQVHKPNMQNPNQFYLASQQQQVLAQAQAQAQGNLGTSPNYGFVGGLPRGNIIMKDGQATRNEASVGSPGQMTSPKVKILLYFGVFSLSMCHKGAKTCHCNIKGWSPIGMVAFLAPSSFVRQVVKSPVVSWSLGEVVIPINVLYVFMSAQSV